MTDEWPAGRYVVAENGCWVWQGAINNKGYAVVRSKLGNYAHRVSYQLAKGPIPEGLELDHVCHSSSGCIDGPDCQHRRCINPDHLEAVTKAVNMARARRTSCRNGHLRTDANTRSRPDGGQECRECHRDRKRERRARIRATTSDTCAQCAPEPKETER